MAGRSFNIVMIGAGNVATQLSQSLKIAGHNLQQVYSQSTDSAIGLAGKLTKNTSGPKKKLNKKNITDAITNFSALSTTADIYIIAIKDDAVTQLVKQLHLNNKLVVHTSGSLPMHVLKPASTNYGVFYPLQTISKDKTTDFLRVPICIEGNSKANEKILMELADSLSEEVHLINSEKRKALHLAAVFACNFSNHLFVLAADLLKRNKLPFKLLLPLIQETVDKLNYGPPSKMQTGPAIRRDKKIVLMHLQMLDKDPELKKLYKLLTESIQNKA